MVVTERGRAAVPPTTARTSATRGHTNMLTLNPEIVCQVIDRARQFQAREGLDLFSKSEDLEEDVETTSDLAEYEGDLTYEELRAQIADLEPDQQVELVATMWLGRGDYEVEEWPSLLDEAKSSWTERTAEYLIGTPLVADYLQEGLVLLGYSCD